MTSPAIAQAKQLGLQHAIYRYAHDNTFHGNSAPSFALEASQKLGIPTQQVFKTLVTQIDSQRWCIALTPASSKLNMKLLAKAAGGKKASMADPETAERITGYVLGGVSPLGQKKLHPTIIDNSALEFERIFVSAGRRGLELALCPQDLGNAINATFANIAVN
jgi:Cys-tRNA(Pro)/Cys-tRNA(Cys) deacylase